jgi:fructose/tagatose bisphosphate aldolase
MAIKNLSELLLEAQPHQYAVVAFYTVDSHFARSVLLASFHN